MVVNLPWWLGRLGEQTQSLVEKAPFSRKKWKEHIEAAEEMFAQTSTKAAPWTLVESEFKWYARLKVLKTIVKKFTQEFGE